MIPLSQVAKEIDFLERQGLPRPAAERKFWELYRIAQRWADSPLSIGAMLDSLLHPKTKDGMIGSVGFIRNVTMVDYPESEQPSAYDEFCAWWRSYRKKQKINCKL